MNYSIVINVYKDQHLVPRLLSQIKEHCPQAKIFIIGDGIKLEDQCKKDTIWFECDRLKGQGQKGLWTERFLKLFLDQSEDAHLIKMDPDTCIWRPFTTPNGDYDIFGTIDERRFKHPYVRGGCIGFTRLAAQKIVASGLLLDDKYKIYNYQRYKRWRWKHETESSEQFAFQDWIMASVGHELNLKLKAWDEVYILGNKNIIPDPKDFAVTHPHPI